MTSAQRWAIILLVGLTGVIGAGGYAARVVLGPPVPATPNVTPVTPSVSLASLVPEPDARAKLSQFYRDLALVIRDPACPLKTTGDFREAYQLAVPIMQTAGRLPSVEAIDEPISQRLTIAMGGLDDKPLAEPTRGVLAGTLESIAAEFGG